jgi:hypothetical protein
MNDEEVAVSVIGGGVFHWQSYTPVIYSVLTQSVLFGPAAPWGRTAVLRFPVDSSDSCP